jgi:hypothetical protein
MAAEKLFENKIKRHLESVGVYALGTPRNKMLVDPVGYYEKRWGGGFFTKSGLPDLHICIHGRSIELEIKAEKGKPSELQKFVMKQINDAGGNAILVYPSDFRKLKDLIANYL